MGARAWGRGAAVLAAWLGAATAAPPAFPPPAKPATGLSARLQDTVAPRIVSVRPKRPAPGAVIRVVLDRLPPKGLVLVVRPRGRRPVPLKATPARGKALEARLPRSLPPGPATLYLADRRRPARALGKGVALHIASAGRGVPVLPDAAGALPRPGKGPAQPNGKRAARALPKGTPHAAPRARGLPAAKAPVPGAPTPRRRTAGAARTSPLRYAGRTAGAWTPPRPARGAVRTAALQYRGGREAARPQVPPRGTGTTGTVRTAALRFHGGAAAGAWRPPRPAAGAVRTAVLLFAGGSESTTGPRGRARRGGITSGTVRTGLLAYRGGSAAAPRTPPPPRAGAVRTAMLRYLGGGGEAASRASGAGRGATAGTVRTAALRFEGGGDGAAWRPPPPVAGAVRTAMLRFDGRGSADRRPPAVSSRRAGAPDSEGRVRVPALRYRGVRVGSTGP